MTTWIGCIWDRFFGYSALFNTGQNWQTHLSGCFRCYQTDRRNLLYMVSAWANRNRMVWGQEKVR
jgi:hypothetical protein